MNTLRRLYPLIVLGAIGCQTGERGLGPTGRPVADVRAFRSRPTLDDEFAEMADRLPGFAGLLFDASGERLIVRLTDPSRLPEARAVVKKFFADRTRSPALMKKRAEQVDAMMAQVAAYDFRQLVTWYQALAPSVLSLPGATMSDIDEEGNQIVFGVESPQAMSAVRDAIRSFDVPADAVHIGLFPSITPLSTSLRGTVRPVVAGVLLDVFLDCSLGFNVGRGLPGGQTDNTWYFVTNSHCTLYQGQVNSDAAGQPNSSNIIGHEVVDPPLFSSAQDASCPSSLAICRYSDAALFAYNTSSFSQGYVAWPPIGSTDFEYAIPVDDEGDPLINMPVSKVGQTTGRTTGTVRGVCVNAIARQTGYWMLCQAFATGMNAGPGDSGSPIVEETQPGLMLGARGLLWGGGGDTVVFSMTNRWINELESVMGGALTTTWWLVPGQGNHPSVEIDGPTYLPPGLACTWTAAGSGGTPPYTYTWSGVLSGGGSSITGVVWESGFLYVTVRDSHGYTGENSIYITIDPGAPAPAGCWE